MLAPTVPETRCVGAEYASVWLKRPIGWTEPFQRSPAVALRLPWTLVVTPASTEASPASLSAGARHDHDRDRTKREAQRRSVPGRDGGIESARRPRTGARFELGVCVHRRGCLDLV